MLHGYIDLYKKRIQNPEPEYTLLADKMPATAPTTVF